MAVTGVAMRAWHGRLAARFERAGDRTTLARAQVCMPLALQRPFYPEGPDCCHVLVLHPPGGMVDGDRLDIRLDLEPRAEALVSTPSAGKWYRANVGAQQSVHARIEPGAHLEWLPLETIVFDGARVRQNLRVELGAAATWTGWEITRLGRSARGEGFTHGLWHSATEVWRIDGPPLWVDRQRVTGGADVMRGRYGLAGFPVVGTLAWVGFAVSPELVAAVRACWSRGQYDGEAGVTRLTEGLLCRYRGESTAEVRAWFTDAWDVVRRHARGRAAHSPRVWRT